jgi:hypothetical protein
MVTITEKGLCICMEDNCPEERREWLIKAIAGYMRHYALNPDKRLTDPESAVVMADLLEELAELK